MLRAPTTLLPLCLALLLPGAQGLARTTWARRSTQAPAARAPTPPWMVAAEPLASPRIGESTDESAHHLSEGDARGLSTLPGLSGLNGKAMFVEKSDIPTKAQVRKALGPEVFVKDTRKSLLYAAMSMAEGAACLALGFLIPMKAAFAPVWLAYAAVTGTVWTGMWVIAHECGHNAFSDNRLIQDAVGYLLHSLLLVPYFSWQHSHAVHHAHTNHITKGETHVPPVVNGRSRIEAPGGEHILAAGRVMGKGLNGAISLFVHLVVGWPAYLLFGATGGPKYGTSNHFIPVKPFDTKLWPGKWPKKVWQSDVGVVAMLGLLAGLAAKFGMWRVLALYAGPYCVTNMWLVGYTWLQHTE